MPPPLSLLAGVPPGRYLSQGLVRWCPQGFYRENYVPFDSDVAQICLACKPGVTTPGAGAKLASDCSVVLPGYGIQSLTNVSTPADIPALPYSSSGLPEAHVCGIGYYSAGGYCVLCPWGAVTANYGSKAIEQCSECWLCTACKNDVKRLPWFTCFKQPGMQPTLHACVNLQLLCY